MTLSETEFKRLPLHLQALFVKMPNPGSDEVEAAFAAFGESKSSAGARNNSARRADGTDIFGGGKGIPQAPLFSAHGDSGTASRFFYCAKASKSDRAGSAHPTVKPQALMRWLCTLITPPGGRILDPFAGSGSTLQAAHECGFYSTGIEAETEYLDDIRARMAAAIEAVENRQLDLFAPAAPVEKHKTMDLFREPEC